MQLTVFAMERQKKKRKKKKKKKKTENPEKLFIQVYLLSSMRLLKH